MEPEKEEVLDETTEETSEEISPEDAEKVTGGIIRD
jgi:hypothetical protein